MHLLRTLISAALLLAGSQLAASVPVESSALIARDHELEAKSLHLVPVSSPATVQLVSRDNTLEARRAKPKKTPKSHKNRKQGHGSTKTPKSGKGKKPKSTKKPAQQPSKKKPGSGPNAQPDSSPGKKGSKAGKGGKQQQHPKSKNPTAPVVSGIHAVTCPASDNSSPQHPERRYAQQRYTDNMITAAVKAGAKLWAAGHSTGTYPHKYGNREGINWGVGSLKNNLVEFPLKTRGFYAHGESAESLPDRVVFEVGDRGKSGPLHVRFVGAMRHGANGDFVRCT